MLIINKIVGTRVVVNMDDKFHPPRESRQAADVRQAALKVNEAESKVELSKHLRRCFYIIAFTFMSSSFSLIQVPMQQRLNTDIAFASSTIQLSYICTLIMFTVTLKKYVVWCKNSDPTIKRTTAVRLFYIVVNMLTIESLILQILPIKFQSYSWVQFAELNVANMAVPIIILRVVWYNAVIESVDVFNHDLYTGPALLIYLACNSVYFCVVCVVDYVTEGHISPYTFVHTQHINYGGFAIVLTAVSFFIFLFLKFAFIISRKCKKTYRRLKEEQRRVEEQVENLQETELDRESEDSGDNIVYSAMTASDMNEFDTFRE